MTETNRYLEAVLAWKCLAARPRPGAHPPYTIHKVKGKFYVQNALGERKNLKGYATEAEARKLQLHLYDALPPAMKKKHKRP